MSLLLWCFTAFHVAAGAASLGQAVRLLTKTERARWRSARAHAVAKLIAWSYPLAAVAGVTFAWRHFQAGRLDGVPIILAPLGWLMLLGLIFAIVDFAEDGVLGNTRG